MTGLVVFLAGLAAALWTKPGDTTSLKRLAPPVVASHRTRWRPGLAALLVVGLVLGLMSAIGVVVVAVVLVAATIGYLIWRRRRDAQALATTTAVARACRILEALLAQGHVPVRALTRAGLDCPILLPAAATAQMGGATAAVLRQTGQQPGAAGLIDVARAWELTERTGAPLHTVLKRCQANLAAQADLATTIAQELSATRASGQILAVLPLAGFGLASFVGGHPFEFLTSTWPGRMCLLVGIALACAGALWSDQLATRAARLTPLRRPFQKSGWRRLDSRATTSTTTTRLNTASKIGQSP
ncbi:MAG: pilus assembly protein TadB [Propionibacteriaceae bacterium]|jgi:tight adherence protein B|nr:pilus assembly protein TadB [Propionibacteriaceae bacterium]